MQIRVGKLRRSTIRGRIIALLLAPMIPLLALLVAASVFAIGPTLNLRNARISVEDAGYPAAVLLVTLQNERELSIVQISMPTPTATSTSALVAARRGTDTASQALVALSSNDSFRGAASAGTIRYLTSLERQVGQLGTERAGIDRGADRTDVMNFYNGLTETTFDLYRSIASMDDATLQQNANATVEFQQASEFLARENALVAGVIAAGHETITDYQQIVSAVGTQRFLFTEASSGLSSSDLASYQQLLNEPEFAGLTKLEDQLTSGPQLDGPVLDKAEAQSWQQEYTSAVTRLEVFEAALGNRTIDALKGEVSRQEVAISIAIGLATILLLVLLLFSLRIARTLIRRLASLRQDALDVADERLPAVVGRVRRGEAVDMAAEAPPLEYGSDELGQLADAFTRVQETAIGAAAQEARLRAGFNQVFLNIARRNQTLLHRQLALLDAMERRAEDPDDLEELFRVDHLATRMRRHAEDLVVLAGSTPGRGWRTPVPFADVLRAAASEVEEYARISVLGVPEAGVTGRAVNDVVHLIAELLENATMFSPPDTTVVMSGRPVADGFLVEITDQGLGMSTAAIKDANARLADPPDFDPSNSSRLGLFVVARLAARHGIRVTLRPSEAGGIVAAALVPANLVVRQGDIAPGAAGGLGARVPVPRKPSEAATVQILAAAPATVETAGPAPRADDTLTITADGLPKRSGRRAAPADSSTDAPATVVSTPVPVVSAPPMEDGSPTGSAPDAEELTADGLPKRGRPRDTAEMGDLPAGRHRAMSAEPTGSEPPKTPTTVRTPEEMRAMLASFQRSSTLGRIDAVLGPHDNGTDGDESGGDHPHGDHPHDDQEIEIVSGVDADAPDHAGDHGADEAREEHAR